MRGLLAVIAAVTFVITTALVACGTSEDSVFPNPDEQDSGTSSGDLPPIGPVTDGGLDLDGQSCGLIVEPADQTVTFTTGQAAPTIAYSAKNSSGTVVPAAFTIDRGEIGAVTLQGGVFTASGKVGGKAKISAAWNGCTGSTSVTVKLKVTENGAAQVDGGGGAGGNGGVGGEGPGGPVDNATATTLKGTPVADTGLAMLYPYDKTVWPRGILAPLLQWKAGAQGDYDAVLIKISETNFEYEGTFAKTATPFIHHPITQTTWKQMLTSNAGEDVTITLLFAKGGVAYGPLVEKWKVSSAPLKGIVYYNSYGTKLAKNYGGVPGETGAKPDNSKFGGATLAIKGSSTDPVLVAGGDGDKSYCRVCHSVAANGSVLITQREDASDRKFSTYDLKGPTETTMSPEGGGAGSTGAVYSWPAIYPDGTLFLGDSSPAAGSTTLENKLFQVVSGAGPKTPTLVTTTGWPAGFRAAFPAFSPDGKNLAFTMYAGATGADTKTLGFMSFDKTTNTFGALTVLHKPANNHTALYPAFLPTNDAVIFEIETRYNGRDYGGTRSDADVAPPDARADVGAHASLWWVDLKTKTAVPLDNLNGKGYVPTGPNGHDDDTTLNYEPTVNPVVSGGYAWVVFTSRRLYGNIATINPFYSDPRFHDLTQTPTPKKLWVAAIDVNAAPGTDPSHPAFYLPAQELLAGNSRGYWVVDPCKSDGNECETGDECCGGFCRPDQNNKLVCTAQVPQCAQEFEKCTTSADCCNSPALQCINGRCAVTLPK